MDRINKFLSKRPVKGQKIIKYNDKKYKVTKSDLKLVRMYKANKCLDKSFDVSKNYPPTKSMIITPIEYKSRDINIEKMVEKTKKRFKKMRKPMERYNENNEIVDIWPEDNMEKLEEYRADSVQTVHEAYNGPIEECRYTVNHLEEDTKRIFLKYFRPRVEKAKKLEDLLPKIPDPEETRPFPSKKSKMWTIGGSKRYYNNFIYSACGNMLEIHDIRMNKLVRTVEMDGHVEKVRVSGDVCVFLVGKIVYRIKNGELFIKVLESARRVYDLCLEENNVGVLTSSHADVCSLSDGVVLKRFSMKNVKPRKMKIVGNVVYVATTNGVMVEGIDEKQIKSLNYVIDLSVKEGKIFVINNTRRLVEITSKGTIGSTVVQDELGIKISCHPTLNLIAVAYVENIGIYKKINNDCFLVNTIAESCHSFDWHEFMPWLYVSKKSKVILYS